MKNIKRVVAVSCLMVCSVFSLTGRAESPEAVDRLVVLGDSLSDDGGDNSTWYLLKTLNGQTGDEGVDRIQPWVRSWLSERVLGYGWMCQWRYIPCRTVERNSLKAAISLLSNTGAVPIAPAPHYANGRWSNGPVWPEYLAGKMGISVTDGERYRNVSHAGGWSLCVGDKALGIRDLTGDLTTVATSMINGSLVPPCLKLIAKGYNYQYGDYEANDLVIVFFGGNDYLNRYQDPARVVEAQAEVIEEAIEKGAKHIAWLNMPDIAQTPRYLTGSGQGIAEETTQLINLHNILQQMSYLSLKNEYTSEGVNLINIDANSIFKDLIENSTEHGLYVVDQPCSTLATPGLDDVEMIESNPSFNALNDMTEANGGICQNQSEYAFWDGVHPSTATHKIIADKACEILNEHGYQCNI